MTDAGFFPDSTEYAYTGGSQSIIDVSLLEKYSREFDKMVQERHEMGAEKYGPGKFLNVDTMQEALYELADMANYARYTFIKVRALQERIAQEGQPAFRKTLD